MVVEQEMMQASGTNGLARLREMTFPLANVWGFVLFAGVCVAALCFLGTHLPEFRSARRIKLEWLLLIAASLNISLFWVLGWKEARISVSSDRRSWLYLAGCSVVLATLVVYNGLRQFGGYDLSGLVQLTWNLDQGLVPYRDFPCTYPPAFFFGALYAAKTFGFYFSSFVYIGGITAAAAFLTISLCIQSAGLGIKNAVGAAVIPVLMTFVLIGYWWWNPLASIAVVLAFASCFSILFDSHNQFCWIVIYASAVLLILNKPNAWPAALCYVSVFFVSRGVAIRALSIYTAAVITAELICRLHGFSLLQTVRAYHSIASTRGNLLDLHAFWGVGVNPVESIFSMALAVALMLLALYAIHTISLKSRKFGPILHRLALYTCLAGALLGGVSLALTNYEMKISDLAPIAFLIGLLTVFRPTRNPVWHEWVPRSWTRLVVLSGVLFCALASLYWGLTRLKVRSIGEDVFYQPQASMRVKTGFFKSVKVGNRLTETLADMNAAIEGRRTQGIFLGPRIEFGYAYFNLPPLKGLPVFWHEGSAYPAWMRSQIEETFWQHHFGTLIFLKDDYTFMPPEMIDRIRREYIKRNDWPLLDVYYGK